MTIGKKIYGSFSLVLAILLAFSIFSLMQLKKIDQEYQHLLDNRMKQVHLSDAIQKEAAMQGLYIRAYYLQRDMGSLSALESHQETLRQSIDELTPFIQSEEMVTALGQIEENMGNFDAAAAEAVDYIKKGHYNRAEPIMNTEIRSATIGIQQGSERIRAFQETLIVEDRAITENEIAVARQSLIIASVVFILLGFLIATFLGRSISRPVKRLVQKAVLISGGDLTQDDIRLRSKDELGDLATAFNEMKGNLHSLIRTVNDNALQVTASAGQLSVNTEEAARTSEELSRHMETMAEGAQTAAASAEGSSSAMEETAVSVQRIAESTQSLQTRAIETMGLAETSEQSVRSAKNQMTVIHDSSSQTNDLIRQLSRQILEIEDITQVITNITEQTNLLALNAAIEAARAGEHGKGFAVVAEEVKKLAEQSKASASQIAQLTITIQQDAKNVEQAVAGSLKNVEEGVSVIDEAGQAFSAIVSAVQQMSGQIVDISAATEEISAGAEEVSASVQEIAIQSSQSSERTRQSTAAVDEQLATLQEINAVAHTLSGQAHQLQQAIQEFRV
ncbi:methyl-accepting chemotaxis protein [Bacillus sp. OxB-1]|uniref:methyl-accepting chemotaxis protein n=1 Tax=Bacillus sp. (strain OxB-1) TaxID=98228 RepID=UPI000581CE30|nr:methyl-accepting chemotaxis protein [Bacillus sp. OxB-1]BAQ10651.1 methyl-accepting chemotaxis protein [Bacillus sp. OxB-1]